MEKFPSKHGFDEAIPRSKMGFDAEIPLVSDDFMEKLPS
jgi:hypothetical protein